MIDNIIFLIFFARSTADNVFSQFDFQLAGMTLSAGAILNVVILGLTAVMFLHRPSSFSAIKIWIPFLFVAALSVAWAPDKGSAVRLLLVLLTYASVFTIPFCMAADRRRSAWLLKAIVYSSVAPAFIGVLGFFLFRDDDGRLKSTFLHPNVFAFYLMIIIGIIFYLLSSSIAQLSPLIRKMLVPYAGLLLGLIILTETRAAWAGVFMILVAFAFLVDRRYLLTLLLLPSLIFVPAVSDRLSDLTRGTEYTGQMKSEDDAINSFAWRQLMWESAMKDSANARMLGKGLASFGPNSVIFFPIVDPDADYGIHGVGAHSAYVQALYETGVVGLLCYIWIYVGVILRTLRQFARHPRGTVIILSIILAFMAANFSDNMFDYGAVNMYFWGFLGIIFAKFERDSVEMARRRTLMQYQSPQPYASP